jgi:hypothetical protein
MLMPGEIALHDFVLTKLRLLPFADTQIIRSGGFNHNRLRGGILLSQKQTPLANAPGTIEPWRQHADQRISSRRVPDSASPAGFGRLPTIPDKLLIAISESFRPLPKSVHHPVKSIGRNIHNI